MATTQFDTLYDMAGGDKSIVKNLLTVLEKNVQQVPQQLENYFKSEDYSSLREVAHKFKSSIGYVGSEAFTETLVKIELSEQEKIKVKELGKLVQDVHLFSKQMLAAIQSELSKL